MVLGDKEALGKNWTGKTTLIDLWWGVLFQTRHLTYVNLFNHHPNSVIIDDD